MRIDNRIAALRDDPVSQRLAHDHLDRGKDRWLKSPHIAALPDELEQYAGGQALSQLHILRETVTSLSAASQFVNDWQEHFARLIMDEPLGHVPFKHNYSAGFATMRLFEAGRVTLSLLAYEEVEPTPPASAAAFSDREQDEIVVAGRAEGLLYSLSDENCDAGDPERAVDTCSLRMCPGSTIKLDGAKASRHILNVRGHLVVLQLSRAASQPQPIREIRLSDGALVHQSSGDKRESQLAMAMAVLTELERADAAPHCAALSLDGPDYLRWDSIRHTLALDPVRGFSLLGQVVKDGKDLLSDPAGALRDQLAAAHPQLLQLEAEQCPA